jgi:uncharacterized membrane protein YsdA (DUF1294 family)/cold shock CspA family protein
MRIDGKLESWNDERGFGFIKPDQGGQDIFVHIKAFPPGTGRPSVGQALEFEVEVGPNGKKRARSVQYPVRKTDVHVPRRETSAPWTLPRLVVLPLFAAVYAYVVTRVPIRPGVALVYVVASMGAFLAYALDKSAAIGGRWRISEQTLHLIALVGGWPGALLAQQLLRHKSSKPGFVAVFWGTVAINVAAFVGWHLGLGR